MAELFCKSCRYPSDTIDTRHGGKLKITFFAHSSLMFEYEGQRVYTDPVGSNADYASLPRADVILVGHEHYDHLDIPVIGQLSDEGTLVVGSKAVVDRLGAGRALAHGQRISLPFVGIEAVAAYNTSPDKQGFHPADRKDNGYILTFGGTRVYVAGDTEDTPEMLALRDIDIAFLPVNLPYTMTEQQAARAVLAIEPSIFYPYHYGQVEHKTDLSLLARLIENSPVEMRIRPLE